MKKFTLFTIVALLAVAMIVPQAMAASKVTPYGRMWFDTMRVTWDKNTAAAATTNTLGLINGSYSPNFDESDTIWTNVTYGMVGFNFKADCFTAKFEINDGAGAANSVDIRHIYGSYNFGMGSILVGHTWDIGYLACIPCLNADGGMVPWVHKGGVPATQAREAQIRLTFPTEFGRLTFALQTPQALGVDTNSALAQADTEVTLPALRFQWVTKPIGPVMFILFAGYNSYESVYNPTPTQELRFDIDSTVLSAQAIANFGPLTWKVQIARSENAENYSADVNPIYNWGAYIYQSPGGSYSVHDNSLFSWYTELTYRITKSIAINLVYGEDEESGDFPGTTREWETDAWAILLPVTICPGFQIIPQVQKVDLGTLNTNGVDALIDSGDATMYGVQWRFTF